MQIYYRSLEAIEQQTLQLDNARCIHCQQTDQLVSHGFVYKKQLGGVPRAVGKRVRCSNRNQHTGCGRTLQLCLDSVIRYLHYSGDVLVAFVLSLINGMSIARAYAHTTLCATPRNAYRWLNKLGAQLSPYRSLFHQSLGQMNESVMTKPSLRQYLLISTFQILLQKLGQPLCGQYQRQWQKSFL